jgi:hypothetical protein
LSRAARSTSSRIPISVRSTSARLFAGLDQRKWSPL